VNEKGDETCTAMDWLGSQVFWCQPVVRACLGPNSGVGLSQCFQRKLESILKELNVSFQKNPGKKEGIYSYDFERKGTKIRLFNYNGEDLWIETDYARRPPRRGQPLEHARQVSRAVLVKDGGNASISLESQIDCTIGLTDGMVRQFVERFDGEVQAFVNFMTK